MANKKARVIAFYLPQYHPTPENDKFWGKGFTEWHNVAKARPLFKGHYQPKLPADLGFYDLRLPLVREQQAQLAREAGVEGFMYWHYWFGNGVMTLQDIFEDVLASGKPDFPFALGWANHSWTNKSWGGTKYKGGSTIFEMKYPGVKDYEEHFNYCLPAFKDTRYITVEGKPIFLIWRPLDMPDVKDFIAYWQNKAHEAGLKGIHFIALRHKDESIEELLSFGFDAVNTNHQLIAEDYAWGSYLMKKARSLFVQLTKGKFNVMRKYNYAKIIKKMVHPVDKEENIYPTILSGYDRAARSGKQAQIYYNYTPELFREHVRETIDYVKDKSDEHKIVILKSWNEWAEGNYMEPDIKYGHDFLDALADEVFEK